ncbi:hypothetical protein KAT67_01315, partial [candidate division WOR-3 bacterium]|nr:hypothetical protein [candidate division WOR-3 bacterium]
MEYAPHGIVCTFHRAGPIPPQCNKKERLHMASTINRAFFNYKLPLDILETFGISLLSISSTANSNLQN